METGTSATPLGTAKLNELEALRLAIERLSRDGLEAQAEALRQLEAKLRDVLCDAQARAFDPDLEAIAEAEGFALRPGPRQSIDPEVFDSLRFAIKARRKVRIDVRYRGSGRAGYQTVHPYGFLYGSRHYLVAFSEPMEDVRMFVLANIERAALLDGYYVPVEGFALKVFAERSFGVFQERPTKVAWRFSAKAAADARQFHFHPSQRLTELADGSLRVEFTAGGLLEMCWHLFTWGSEVEIVKPKRLRAMMQRLLLGAAGDMDPGDRQGQDITS